MTYNGNTWYDSYNRLQTSRLLRADQLLESLVAATMVLCTGWARFHRYLYSLSAYHGMFIQFNHTKSLKFERRPVFLLLLHMLTFLLLYIRGMKLY